jgi:hypothetical protein
MTRKKKRGINTRPSVPQARSIKKSPVDPGYTNCANMEKKKALSPKAARGTPVAVPRWRGQLSADVLIAAANAAQPPRPVKYEYMQSNVIDPEPLSYAWCRGK